MRLKFSLAKYLGNFLILHKMKQPLLFHLDQFVHFQSSSFTLFGQSFLFFFKEILRVATFIFCTYTDTKATILNLLDLANDSF